MTLAYQWIYTVTSAILMSKNEPNTVVAVIDAAKSSIIIAIGLTIALALLTIETLGALLTLILCIR